MSKKVLSIVLALCMVLTLLPTTAFAVDGPEAMAGTGQASGEMTAAQFLATAQAGKITLTGNVKLTDAAFTAKGVGAMEIDLASCTLDTGNCLLVPTGAVVITGNDDGKIFSTGTAANGGKPITNYPIFQLQQNNSSLTVKGGTIDGGSRIAIWAIENNVTNSVNIEGGTVTGSIGILTTDDCTVKITGGTIKGTAEKNGPGMQNGGSATISGGTLTSDHSSGVLVMGSLIVEDGATIKTEDTSNAAALQVNAKTKDDGTAIDTKATATINGGTITGKAAAVISVNKAEVTITGGEITSNGSDDRGSAIDFMGETTAKISGGTITGNSAAIFAAGKANVTVSDKANITGASFGISTNGTNDAQNENYGKDVVITVTGGTVTGGDKACGVYLPAGKMTVSGGTVKGGAGVVVRGGGLEVKGGNIIATATGDITVGDAAKDGERYSVPAAGITMDSNEGYKSGDKKVTVSDGNINGNPTVAYTVMGEAATPDASEKPIEISGGTLMCAHASTPAARGIAITL